MYIAAPVRPKIVPMTWDQIIGNGAPRNANQPEAFRDVLFDTQTYVDNTTTTLSFFQSVQTDRTLGNLQQAGSLPAATAFAISAISSEWLIGFEAGGAGGGAAVADLSALMVAARPTLLLTLADKTYGPWPLAYAGSAGHPAFFGYGTTTADANAASGAQNVSNGGFFVGNGLILLPNVQFSLTVQFAAAQNISGDRRLRISLHGTRYRRVV